MYIDLNDTPGVKRQHRNKNKDLRSPSKMAGSKREIPNATVYEKDPLEQLLIFRHMRNFSYFGEEDIIKRKPRTYTAVCITDCEFFTLDKIEIETIIKEEYPLIYEKLVQTVAEKGRRDFQTKKDLLQIYKKFADVDENKFDSTLTVQDMKLLDDVPSLEELYSEAIVFHPVEILLNTFNSGMEVPDEDDSQQKAMSRDISPRKVQADFG